MFNQHSPRRVVLQGWFGMDNFGDDLLLEVTLSHLLENVENIRIDVIGEGRKRPLFLPSHVGYLPRASRKWSWLRRRWLRSGCDWVLCGGGVLKADVLQRFIEPAEQVKQAGGRVFLHAIGLRGSLDMTDELRRLMDRVDGCSVRETHGWDQLSQIGSVEMVADPVFAMDISNKPACSDRLLIALRGFEQSQPHIERLAELLISHKEKFSSVDLLVCFPQQDLEISKQLVEALPEMRVQLINHPSAFENAHRIATADRVITMRLHPAIVALAAGMVPWVLEPEHKHRQLMQDVGKQAGLLSWGEIERALIEAVDDEVDRAALQLQGRRSLELLAGWVSNE